MMCFFSYYMYTYIYICVCVYIYIVLFCFFVIYLFLKLWYRLCSFSMSYFRETWHFCVFVDLAVFFPYVFELKKTRIEISRRLVIISARELRSETISCIFLWFRYQNNPRLSWSLYIVYSCIHLGIICIHFE